MSMQRLFILFGMFLLLSSACKKKDDSTNPPITTLMEGLEVEIQQIAVSPPSKVSVFFRVTEKDGDPVAGLTPENFTILEQGRNDDEPKVISADEAERIISDNEQVFDYKVMLLLDLSGSVVNNNLENLKQAARQFVIDAMQADINSSTQIGVWWFDGADVLHPLINFTNNPVELQEAILGINASMSNDNSTDLFGAIIKATTLAESALETSEIQGSLAASSIIVFTDGTDQAARYAKEDAFEAVNMASENINYYSIGLGSEIDELVLNKIGKNSSVFANDTDSLVKKFEEIAELIHNETNSFYLFEYCTPKRDGSGTNGLHIRVEESNRKGETDSTFDATGFHSGCVLF